MCGKVESLAIATLLALAAAHVSAQTPTGQTLPITAIDSASGLRDVEADLTNGVDFRQIEWRACFRASQCKIGGVEIIAEARSSDTQDWEPAQLYWGPIDGFGVIGNGQDDEIDFNERIILNLDEARPFEGIWFSDIFVGEIQRYLGLETRAARNEDHEVARFALEHTDGTQYLVDLDGLTPLPPDSFNRSVDAETFVDDGDLHARLLVNGPTVALELPSRDDDGNRRLIDFKLGDIEEGKLSLFEEGDELAYDFDEVFADGVILSLQTDLQHNARQVENTLNDPEALMAWGSSAREGREERLISNGEVGAFWDKPMPLSRIEFYAPMGTSNDYSIAGLALAPR